MRQVATTFSRTGVAEVMTVSRDHGAGLARCSRIVSGPLGGGRGGAFSRPSQTGEARCHGI